MSCSLITLKLKLDLSEVLKMLVHGLRASFLAAVAPFCSSISISRTVLVSSSDFWFYLHQQCFYFFQGTCFRMWELAQGVPQIGRMMQSVDAGHLERDASERNKLPRINDSHLPMNL